MSWITRKSSALLALFGLTFLNLSAISYPSFALTPAQTLDACVAAINDPLYTRSTIPGLTGFANAAAIETAIGNGTLVVYIASGPGQITGSASANGNGRDFFCGDSSNNSVPSMDSDSTTRDYFWGGGGNDSVSGTMWASTFWGGPGDDTVNTLEESSLFYGGPGNDSATYIRGGSTFEQGVDPDITAPTFPSAETFSVAENSTSVGSITTSESATISIDGGEDRLKFSLTRQSTTVASLAFLTAPDFEIPSDVGLNNTYVIVVKGVDSSSNAGYETVTVTVTDLVDTTSYGAFTIAGNAKTANYRENISLTATVNVASKITFYSNGKRIAGCISKLATGSGSTFTYICTWRPTQIGYAALSSRAVPLGGGITSANSTILSVFVTKRTSTRQ